jgi:hypothetical protein
MKGDGGNKAEECADHKEIAVSKVYHGEYTVHHGVAQGNQCIDTADLERIQKLLKDVCHLISDETDFISFSPPFQKGQGDFISLPSEKSL